MRWPPGVRRNAYAISTGQVDGGPAWADRDRFNLEAKAEQPATIFATRLRPFIDRPVSNQTGLPGAYDFELTFTMQPPSSMVEGVSHNGVVIDFSGPTISKAVSELLGLRLDPGKGEIQTIVVERAEPLIAN